MAFREPQYYDNGYARYEEPARMTFREPRYYDDGCYHRIDYRDQYPVLVSGGYLIPREQVLVRAEDAPLSWWHNSGYPYASYINVESPEPVTTTESPEPVTTTVELYVPQLYSDYCERRVKHCLDHMKGVETVSTDQWEKKVVVVGKNLCPNDVLRRLQRKLHMDRSVFWQDRRT